MKPIINYSKGNCQGQVLDTEQTILPYFSRRDDENRTALMLAAADGHTLVMKILLDNHAPVNEVDKLKVQPPHKLYCKLFSPGNLQCFMKLMTKIIEN